MENVKFQNKEHFSLYWYEIHSYALHKVKNSRDKLWYDIYIENLIDLFPCLDCKQHFRKYVMDHPISNAKITIYKNMDVTYFQWTVDFHNSVNMRLHKPTYTLEQAYNIYTNQGPECDQCIPNGSGLPVNTTLKITQPTTVNKSFIPPTPIHKSTIIPSIVPPIKKNIQIGKVDEIVEEKIKKIKNQRYDDITKILVKKKKNRT